MKSGLELQRIVIMSDEYETSNMRGYLLMRCTTLRCGTYVVTDNLFHFSQLLFDVSTGKNSSNVTLRFTDPCAIQPSYQKCIRCRYVYFHDAESADSNFSRRCILWRARHILNDCRAYRCVLKLTHFVGYAQRQHYCLRCDNSWYIYNRLDVLFNFVATLSLCFHFHFTFSLCQIVLKCIRVERLCK